MVDRKLKSVLVAKGLLLGQVAFELTRRRYPEKEVKEASAELKVDYYKIANEMLDDIFGRFKLLNIDMSDFVAIEKYDDFFLVIFFYETGEYFFHIYDEETNHKGSNLFAICDDIVLLPKGNYPVNNRTVMPLEMFIRSSRGLSDRLDFYYSKIQPDLALLTILFDGDREKAYEFAERGNPSSDEDKRDFKTREKEYFEKKPELKKYAAPMFKEWNLARFEVTE